MVYYSLLRSISLIRRTLHLDKKILNLICMKRKSNIPELFLAIRLLKGIFPLKKKDNHYERIVNYFYRYGYQKLLTLLAGLFVVITTSFGQVAGDFRTNGDVTFAAAGNWQRSNGAIWVAAGAAPISTDGVRNAVADGNTVANGYWDATGTWTTTSCGGAHVHAVRMAGDNALHRSERKNCE